MCHLVSISNLVIRKALNRKKDLAPLMGRPKQKTWPSRRTNPAHLLTPSLSPIGGTRLSSPTPHLSASLPHVLHRGHDLPPVSTPSRDPASTPSYSPEPPLSLPPLLTHGVAPRLAKSLAGAPLSRRRPRRFPAQPEVPATSFWSPSTLLSRAHLADPFPRLLLQPIVTPVLDRTSPVPRRPPATSPRRSRKRSTAPPVPSTSQRRPEPRRPLLRLREPRTTSPPSTPRRPPSLTTIFSGEPHLS